MSRSQPRQLHRLTALTVKNVQRPGWHADGGGLYLEVDKSGAKRWAMRLTVNGHRHDYGLGPIQKVSLQQARTRAAEYREKAYVGVEPVPRKRRRGVVAEDQSLMTFERAADTAHLARKGGWSNGKHVDQWINTLRDHAFPTIGKKAVADVTTADVLAVLTPIWMTKPETARRVRQRMRTVLEWARVAGHRSGDNPVDLIGEALPKQRIRVEHHDALPYTEVGAFIAALRAGRADDATKAAFELMILTAARTREVRLATWSEFDIEAKLWTVPAERMKARREHVVPLSDRVVEILVEQRAHYLNAAPGDPVFVDKYTGKALSENRFLNARDAIGYGDKCTPHGFRSSFRDWAAEETSFPAEVVEMALAHTIASKTEAAYRRGDLLAKRRELMAEWGGYAIP